MELLLEATSIRELKQAYKKLATLLHPDRGGSLLQMQKLNDVYQACIKQFKQITYGSENFSHISTGQQLFVNGTLCEVIATTPETFRVVAVGRSRQAVFDKKTGIGKYNQRLRASFDPNRYSRNSN